MFGRHAVTGLILANGQKTFDPGLLFSVPNGLMGIAARATYDFSKKYLFEFNLGYNGTEQFAEGKRFGFFPAVSLGWVATNESFIPKNDVLSYLKIRGSYGEVGNDLVGGRRFLYLPNTWGYGSDKFLQGYYFGSSNGSNKDTYFEGAWETTVGNPDVTWERARKMNLGIDMNFFRNRLKFVGDVFQEKRNNILWQIGTIPGIVGSALPPANIGIVTNKGYEGQLSWDDVKNDFSYGLRINVSYAKNRIDYLSEPTYPYEWMNTTGYSIGQYKGYLTNGFYNTQEEVAQHLYSTFDGNKVQLGDIRYVDVNGDGTLDTRDRVPIGYSNFPRYTFGSGLNVGYKSVSLSVLFTGSAQGSMPVDFYMMNPFFQGGGTAFKYQYEGRWTPEKAANGITPTFPRASTRTQSSISGLFSDFWLQSTDHIRLKNVELAYMLQNKAFLQRVNISAVRLYLNGNNLYTWSKMIPGYDPEQQDSGGAASGYLYPMTRVFNFGVNVTF